MAAEMGCGLGIGEQYLSALALKLLLEARAGHDAVASEVCSKGAGFITVLWVLRVEEPGEVGSGYGGVEDRGRFAGCAGGGYG